MKTYKVIGLMSGSSLDGLDVAYCQLAEKGGRWEYRFLLTECLEYPPKWKLRLINLAMQNAITYLKTDVYYGRFLGETVRAFIDRHGIEADLVASHGHTVFHQPENNVSSQVGSGAAISALAGLPVVCDFRTLDVVLGGQGAPVAPIGDKLLFPEYLYCLNIGGIANISIKNPDGRLTGFDICPANFIINELAGRMDLEMDKDGAIARTGKVDDTLLGELNAIWYYEKPPPKSLGIGWINKVMHPIIRKSQLPVQDILRTYYEHVALQVGKTVASWPPAEIPGVKNRMLVTGGGAFNGFLMELIGRHTPTEVVVPEPDVVKFKEALVMALMGVLRIRGEVNCLSSVTGASCDNTGGVLHGAFPPEMS